MQEHHHSCGCSAHGPLCDHTHYSKESTAAVEASPTLNHSTDHCEEHTEKAPPDEEDAGGPARLRLNLPNLTCAHCAAKIEQAAGDLPGVQTASLNFLKRELQLLHRADPEDLLDAVSRLADRIEPGTIVQAVTESGQETVFSLPNLTCPNCAAKIEAAVAKLPEVQEASLNLMDQRLRLCHTGDPAALQAQVQDIADRIEPGTVVQLATADKAVIQARLIDGLLARKKTLAMLASAAVLFIAGFALGEDSQPALLAFLMAFVVVGGPVLVNAVKGFARRQFFNEEVLMAIAAVGAFGIGAWEEAVAVMLFYQTGELVQDLAVDRSRRSISGLMDIRPDFANLMEDGAVREVAPESVAVGSRILVRPGERVPLDGKVVTGTSQLDTSALTGESMPRTVGAGDEVLSGSINLSGVLELETLTAFVDSTVAKILELVENASDRKARMERFITRFAAVYTPTVVACAVALCLIPTVIFGPASFETWLYRALIFLVCSCPCALVISVPLTFFAGIGGASRSAILVKGATYLETLAEVDTVVFDKTGTLTEGRFAVVAVKPAAGVDEERVYRLATALEDHSTHPIAQAVSAAFEGERPPVSELQEVSGRGLTGKIDGRLALVGNARLLTEAGIDAPPVDGPASVVYVAYDGRYLGHIVVSDDPKESSRGAIAHLKKMGVGETVMLTGDRHDVAEWVGADLGIDRIESELLPQDKVTALEQLQAEGRCVAFVGDGLNDAPVLALANVGIAMGALGSDAAIEAADVVLMTDEPAKVAEGIALARRTRRIVWQNVIFALGVKAVVMLLGALGFATMWAAVFADVGVTIIAILNAMRAMYVRQSDIL